MFEKYVRRHLSKEHVKPYTLFVEGHHHQDLSFELEECQYVNLPAFACGLEYMYFIGAGLERFSFENEQV